MGRKYSQAQNRATQKYIKGAYDSITLRVPKGEKEKIKDFAESNGESMNGYINRLIDEDMKGE